MRVLFISLLIVIADQVSKILVKGISIPFLNINIEGMRYGQNFDVLGSFFKIWFVENPGMAFGIEVGDSSKFFLSLFSLFAGIGIIIYLYKMREEKFVVRLALALILGGAIGNFIDRTFYGVIYGYAPIFYGKVVDFLSVDFFDFTIFGNTYERWPIFNIADSSVSIGVVLLLIFHNSSKSLKENDAVIENEESELDKLNQSDIESDKLDHSENPLDRSPDENNITPEPLDGKDNK